MSKGNARGMRDDTISRQAAIETILECCPSDCDNEYECGYDDGLRGAVHKLKHLPSAQDVVEVVRCKDCKYFDQAEKYCCDFLTAEEDGFCKWGERRTDDDRSGNGDNLTI